MMQEFFVPSKQFGGTPTLPFLCQDKPPDAPAAKDSAPGSDAPGDRETEGNLTPEDEQIVLERLRQLGYVE